MNLQNNRSNRMKKTLTASCKEKEATPYEMPTPFLDAEAERIVRLVTGTGFCVGKRCWLYFLVRIELVPGGWCASIFLERNTDKEPDFSFNGFGWPSEAVKMAWAEIPPDWFKKGAKAGRNLLPVQSPKLKGKKK